MTEQYANSAQGALAAPITSGATSLTLTGATNFPTSGNFRLLVDSELMLCTSISGVSLTVTRGVEGTTAAAHASGALATVTLTAAALVALLDRLTPSKLPLPSAAAPSNSYTGGQTYIYDAGANLSNASGGGTTGVAIYDGPNVFALTPATDGTTVCAFVERYVANPFSSPFQGTAANKPYYDLYAMPGGHCVAFGGRGAPFAAAPTWLTTGAAVVLDSQNGSLIGWLRVSADGVICQMGTGSGDGFTLRTTSANPFSYTVGGTTCSFAIDTPETSWLADDKCHWFVLEWCQNNSSGSGMFELIVDGVAVPIKQTLATQSGGSLFTTLTLGATNAGTGGAVFVLGYLGLFNYRLTAGEISAWVEYLKTKWPQPMSTIYQGPPSKSTEPPRIVSVAIGDSIQSGTYEDRTQVAPNVAVTNLGSRFLPLSERNNFAVLGTRLVVNGSPPDFLDVNDQFISRAQSALAAGATNIVFVEGGINDIQALAPVSSGDVITDTAIMLGWHTTLLNTTIIPYLNSIANGANQYVVLETITFSHANTGPPNGMEGLRAAVNAYLVGTWGNLVVGLTKVLVADVGGDIVLGTNFGGAGATPTKPYFGDDTHLSRFGQARKAGLLMSVITSANL